MFRLALRTTGIRICASVGLLGLLVSSWSVSAQSATETALGAISTVGPVQSDSSTVVEIPKKFRKTRSTLPGTSQLCFMPGVGWQSIPLSTGGNAEGSSGLKPFDNFRIRQFEPKRASKSPYRRPSGGEQASDIACSGFAGNTVMSAFSMANRADPMTPSGSMGTTSDRFSVNSELNSAGTAASQGATQDTTPKRSVGISILGTHLDGLRDRAYASPFKLRREIWNAPDLQTRIKLGRQLEIQAKKATRSGKDLRTSRSTKEKGRNMTKTHRRYREEDDTSMR